MPAIPATVAGFISGGRVGRLGTADATGQPLVVPICYAFDGESLFSAIDAKPKTTGPSGLKRIRNIRENAKVSVVIDRYDEDWSAAPVRDHPGARRSSSPRAAISRGAWICSSPSTPSTARMGLDRETGLMIQVTARARDRLAVRAE